METSHPYLTPLTPSKALFCLPFTPDKQQRRELNNPALLPSSKDMAARSTTTPTITLPRPHPLRQRPLTTLYVVSYPCGAILI